MGLVHIPEVHLRAGTAAGIDREVVLRRELFEEAEGMALTAVRALKLL